MAEDAETTDNAEEIAGLREKIAMISAENCQLMAECHRLASETNQFQSLLRNASEAIVVLTPDGRIQSFNRAAERVFGHAENEMVGQPLSTVIPCPSHHGNVASFLKEYCSAEQSTQIGRAHV